MVGEADPAVELRVAGQWAFKPWHADQNETYVASIGIVVLVPAQWFLVGLPRRFMANSS